jgi:hypothetical protein
VQAWLAAAGRLAANNYNVWGSKHTTASATDYFGDLSQPDMGIRVDSDATCSRATNTFLHLANGGIQFTPPHTGVAENMICGAGQTLSFEDTDFLMLNKADGSSVTTYFVSKYDADEASVGCNDLLGYTVVTFEGSGQPLLVERTVLPFAADTNQMMSLIVANVTTRRSEIVRVAETYLHECGHQSGLLHQSDEPECADPTTLHIARVMNPGGSVRRAFSRLEWCMVRGTVPVTTSSLTPFTQAPELPDSGSLPT